MMDLALNKPKRLIFHLTKEPNQPKFHADTHDDSFYFQKKKMQSFHLFFVLLCFFLFCFISNNSRFLASFFFFYQFLSWGKNQYLQEILFKFFPYYFFFNMIRLSQEREDFPVHSLNLSCGWAWSAEDTEKGNIFRTI